MSDGKGKYFCIKSRLNGLVLQVRGKKTARETPIETGELRNNDSSQLFYEDPITGTIRTKLNDFCLEVLEDVNYLAINGYSPGSNNQQWMLAAGKKIQNRLDPDRVLNLSEDSQESGVGVCVAENTGSESQLWDFHFQDPQYFYIKSQQADKQIFRVIDILKGDPRPGAEVVIWEQDFAKESQLWYEDRNGLIRNKTNDYVMEIGKSDQLFMQPYEAGKMEQQWVITENKIVNRINPGKVLDIKGAKKKDGADVIAYQYRGQDNQHWTIEYQR